MIARVESLSSNNTFLTAEIKEAEQIAGKDTNYGRKHNISMSHSRSAGKLDDESKIEHAIQEAEVKMEGYLASMRNSFILEDN